MADGFGVDPCAYAAGTSASISTSALTGRMTSRAGADGPSDDLCRRRFTALFSAKSMICARGSSIGDRRSRFQGCSERTQMTSVTAPPYRSRLCSFIRCGSVGHRRRQRRIMHVLYVGAQGTVALEDYAKDLRSRLRVDTERRRRLELRATASPRSRRLRRCFPVSKSSSRLPPEEAVLERHLREICPLRGRLRGFKSSQSVQHRLTS